VEHPASGSLLFWFRFTLCTTIILVPQALAIRGFEPEQIGLRSSGVLCHLFLSRSRLHFYCYANLIPVSSSHRLACTAFAAWLNSQYSSTWAAENFYRTELLTGVGQAFAFIGLVGCIVLQAIFAGLWPSLSGSLLFRLFFTPSVYSAAPQAPSTWPFSSATRKVALELVGIARQQRGLANKSEHSRDDRSFYAKSSGLVTAGARAVDLIAAACDFRHSA